MAIVKKDLGDVKGAKADCTRALADLAKEAELLDSATSQLVDIRRHSTEMTEEHSVAELQYRKSCQVDPNNALGFERLGRLYLTFRETTILASKAFMRALSWL